MLGLGVGSTPPARAETSADAVRNEDGKPVYYSSAFNDDWAGSYSHEPDSEMFIHASVYVEPFRLWR